MNSSFAVTVVRTDSREGPALITTEPLAVPYTATETKAPFQPFVGSEDGQGSNRTADQLCHRF